MEAIRTKDRLFLAVVVPAVVVAAYVALWRTDAAKQVSACVRERAALVAVEDFQVACAQAERCLAEARAEMDAERAIPIPVVRVRADAAESVAARERAVLAVFRESGMVVTSSAACEPGDGAGGDVLRRTGTRPAPVCRTYALDGRYPDLLAALRAMAAREMAVVPARVEMAQPGRWTVALWL